MRLRGCFNFRDLGGYETDVGRATRYQRLFRSDELNLLTAADQDELARLGLATVIDLRTAEEVGTKGRANVSAVRYQLPIDDSLLAPAAGPWHAEPALVAETYVAALAGSVETLREVLAVLTDPSTYPAVISCSSGVERTGIVTAVVLGLLGIPDDRIVSDFAGSREAVLRRIGRLRFEHPLVVSDELDRYGAGLLGVVPEAMTLFLHRIREEYGSLLGYAQAIDMAGAVPYLRAAVLEP